MKTLKHLPAMLHPPATLRVAMRAGIAMQAGKNKKGFIQHYFFLKKSSAGFTLIETLIYIAILGMVVSSVVAYTLSLSGSRNKNYVVQNVQANSRTMLSIMSEKIRASSMVVTPSAGASGNQLVLDMPGVSPNIIFSVSSGQLIMTEVGSPDVALTDSRVVVTGLVFTNAAASNERDIINIQATVSYKAAAGDVEHSYTQDLRTAVIRRN